MARGVDPIERVTLKLIELTNCDAINWEEDYVESGRRYSLEIEGQMRVDFPGKCRIIHSWFSYYFEFSGNFYTQGWRKSIFKFDELWKAIYWQQHRKDHNKLMQGASILQGMECPDERIQKKPEHKVQSGGGVPLF